MVSVREISRSILIHALVVRVLFAVLFLGGTVFFFLRNYPEFYVNISSLVTLGGGSFVFAAIAGVLIRQGGRAGVVSHFFTVWDLLFSASLVAITGIAHSPFVPLFIIAIVGGIFFLRTGELFLTASGAAILMGSLVDLQYYGYLDVDLFHIRAISLEEAFYTVFSNVGAFFLAAILSAALVRRLTTAEKAREQISLDYRELEKLNRAILENIQAGIIVVNQGGRIRLFNRAASLITGYTLEQVYNKDAFVLFPGLKGEQEEFGEIGRGEFIFLPTNGSEKVLGFNSNILAQEGSEIRYLITFRDLTEIKRLENHLKRRDRMVSLGRLASGLAHEIRNPLASLSGSAQFLAQSENPSGDRGRLLRLIEREADRLNKLLSDFLEFARPVDPGDDRVDILLTVQDVFALLASDCRCQGVKLVLEHRSGVCWRGDAAQLRQVIWNLVLNGCEACDGKGMVRVSSESAAEIVVEDSGAGIAPDLRDQIFEPFFTRKERGTGLGLAKVHSIIQAHDGLIYVDQSELGGAAFRIQLPPERVC